MSTTKQRINITTSPELESALKTIARRDGVPVATKAAELIAIGLELEEDIGLVTLAEERSKTPREEFIPHGKIRW